MATMSNNIKLEFGRQFRAARDAKKLSRAALGLRLGISPKTIQSWEMGRTFIENLSLIPPIEAELEISISGLIAKATSGSGTSKAAESPASYGAKKSGYVKAGPLSPNIEMHVADNGVLPDEETLRNSVVAIPLVRPNAIAKPVSELTSRDISDHVIIPGEWVPRGGVLIACRMPDAGMVPMVPLGGTVVIDCRKSEPDKMLGKVVAMYLESKGMRIRRLYKDHLNGKLYGVTAIEGRRGKIPFREDHGDVILGRIIGVVAQPE